MGNTELYNVLIFFFFFVFFDADSESEVSFLRSPLAFEM